MDISDDDGDKEADYNYEDVPDDRDWIEEEGASEVKKLKLAEAHPGANFRVLRTVLYAHGRLDFNRHLALWDLPSLYQVAAHDKVLADALMGNEAARVRYQARQASLDARVMAWAAIEVNVVMWFDSRLSDKGRAEGINYRHVAVCAYVAATPGEWGVKWPGMHGYMIRGSTHTGNVTIDTQSKDEAYIAALPVIRFLLSRALDLTLIDSTMGTFQMRTAAWTFVTSQNQSAWAILFYQAFHPDPALLNVGEETARDLEYSWDRFKSEAPSAGKPSFVILDPTGGQRPIAAPMRAQGK